jgi:translation initiation factor IF-2
LATKKIRVYELARELGVENSTVVELAEELKIGVKSHSSSIDEPSADRVRRLADSRGLKREPEPEPEPEPVLVPAAAPVEVEETPPEPVRPEAPPAPVAAPEPVPTRARKVVRSSPTPIEPRIAEAPVREVREAPPAPAPAPTGAPEEPVRPAARTGDAAAPAARGPAESVGDKPRRIPPPPRSASGKPIPPPPGQGRRTPPPPRARPGPSISAGLPRAGGFRQRPPMAAPGGPGGPGGGYGAPGGRGGPGGGPPGGRPGDRFGGRGRPAGGRRKKRRRRQQEELQPAEAQRLTPVDAPVPEGEVVVPRGITIQELAPKFNRTTADLVRLLFDAGEMVTATQSMSDEMIDLVADTLGVQYLIVEPGAELEAELQSLLDEHEDEETGNEQPRAPVVTVMGHVDHGKTTLLDHIRKSDVASGEAGGITQHIGAYQVRRNGRSITFIDTPGHEAFTAMRARGAQATDVAVLVVAADDGVMPQTVEAISHAKAADVPIVVAITKADREDADTQRVRQQLAERELVPEEWGGDTMVNDVSGVTGQGVDELLESILLTAEVEELDADPEAPARAFVLESNVDPGRGPVITALVTRGTLRRGDTVVAGGAWGRVRAMFDEHGQQVPEAGPSTPVEVLGLDDVPLAGDELRVAPNDKVARTIAEARARHRHQLQLAEAPTAGGGAKLEDVFAMVQRGEQATLNLIVKADVQGSLEALTQSLRKIDAEHDEVRLSFVLRGVGGITESDITLASVSNASVIGFNVRPDRKARELAHQEGVEIRTYEVIYQILEDVNNALLGLLAPEFEEVVTGEAEVREVFSVPRVGRVAGCYVQHGVITRGSKVRFLRDGTVIWKGEISSLKRFKDDVREVQSGYECGIGLENFQDLKSGDVIETYEEREIARAAARTA